MPDDPPSTANVFTPELEDTVFDDILSVSTRGERDRLVSAALVGLAIAVLGVKEDSATPIPGVALNPASPWLLDLAIELTLIYLMANFVLSAWLDLKRWQRRFSIGVATKQSAEINELVSRAEDLQELSIKRQRRVEASLEVSRIKDEIVQIEERRLRFTIDQEPSFILANNDAIDQILKPLQDKRNELTGEIVGLDFLIPAEEDRMQLIKVAHDMASNIEPSLVANRVQRLLFIGGPICIATLTGVVVIMHMFWTISAH